VGDCLVDKRIITRAKIPPSVRWDNLRRHVRDVLSKDSCEASIHMPIDVAMEKPGAAIVRKEADCDIISNKTDIHDISDNRIVEVVSRVVSGADHMEGVTVQMNRVSYTKSTTRDSQLNTLVSSKTINAASRKEVRRFLRTTQDLE